MSGSRDGLQSGSDSPASPASSATFDPSDDEDQQTTWEVEPPEFEPQDDYEAIVDLLTDWAYGYGFAFLKERSWQDRAGTTYKVKLLCDRACAGGTMRSHRANNAQTRRSSTSKVAPVCPFRITVSALKSNHGQWAVAPNQQCLRHEGHTRSKLPIEHLHFRKHYITPTIRRFIEEQLEDKTVRMRGILARIQMRYPEVQLRTVDLTNWRYRIERERKRGYSDIQRFIGRLKQSSHVANYCIKWEGEPGDDEGHGDPDASAGPAGHAADDAGAFLRLRNSFIAWNA